MANFALQMIVGDRRRVRITASWPEAVPELGVAKGQAYDLSTANKIWFTGKAKKNDPDNAAVIKKDTSLAGINQITFGTGPTAGTAYADIVEADTANYATITRLTKLFCEVQIKASTGETWTVTQGELTLLPQIQLANT